jgi:hypothetical protein
MSEERAIYQRYGVRISKSDIGYTVSTLKTKGHKSKNVGEEAITGITYHPNLASACEEAALRITDDYEAASLKAYSRELRNAIAELRSFIAGYCGRTVEASEGRKTHSGTRSAL